MSELFALIIFAACAYLAARRRDSYVFIFWLTLLLVGCVDVWLDFYVGGAT